MVSHNDIGNHTPSFSPADMGPVFPADNSDRQVDYTLLAQKVRDAFHTAMAPSFAESISVQASAPEEDNFLDVVSIVTHFNEQVHTRQNELNKPVDGYSFEEKLTILHDRLGIIPAARKEASDAFWLTHRADRGQDAADGVSIIAGHQYKAAEKHEDSAEKGATSAMRARKRKVSDYDAFVSHAEASLRNLKRVDETIATSIGYGERYASLAKFFAARGTPWHEGRGQLTRYIATLLKAAGVAFPGDKLAFSAKLGKDTQNRSTVHDPFIAQQPSREIVSLERALLSAIPMSAAPRILGYARYNEMKLSKFWTVQRDTALQDEATEAAASTILRSKSA